MSCFGIYKMLTLTLMRMPLPGHTTYGVLYNGDVPFALTLELPWINNQVNISCIPARRYLCKRVVSPKFAVTYEITNVKGRAGILFHRGNTVQDSKGCVILGEAFEPIAGVDGITQSGHAFNEFMNMLEDDDYFYLNIYQLIAPPIPAIQ